MMSILRSNTFRTISKVSNKLTQKTCQCITSTIGSDLLHTSQNRVEAKRLISSSWMSMEAPRFSRGFATYPPYTPVKMPALSPTMEKGTLAKWSKNEGDEIQPGDLLAEVETDKATVDFESQDEGYLAKILVPEGTADVPLGKVVAIMVEDEDAVAKFKDFDASELEEGDQEDAPNAEAKQTQKEEKSQQQQSSTNNEQKKMPEPSQQYEKATQEQENVRDPSKAPKLQSKPMVAPEQQKGKPLTSSSSASSETRNQPTKNVLRGMQRSPLFDAITKSQLEYEARFGKTYLLDNTQKTKSN